MGRIFFNPLKQTYKKHHHPPSHIYITYTLNITKSILCYKKNATLFSKTTPSFVAISYILINLKFTLLAKKKLRKKNWNNFNFVFVYTMRWLSVITFLLFLLQYFVNATSFCFVYATTLFFVRALTLLLLMLQSLILFKSWLSFCFCSRISFVSSTTSRLFII